MLLTGSIVTRSKSVAVQLYHPPTSSPTEAMARLFYSVLDPYGLDRNHSGLHCYLSRQVLD